MKNKDQTELGSAFFLQNCFLLLFFLGIYERLNRHHLVRQNFRLYHTKPKGKKFISLSHTFACLEISLPSLVPRGIKERWICHLSQSHDFVVIFLQRCIHLNHMSNENIISLSRCVRRSFSSLVSFDHIISKSLFSLSLST